MDKNYNIGLDIGTHSVGWAVTDENYNILKFKKQNMWGVRLFDEGQTAETRRINRNTRRRLNRRKERVALLQMLLGEDIEKVDKVFFRRLKESFLHIDEREDKVNKSNLFVGKNFSDKEYYAKYPTIYHLRKELIENTDKKDIRLVYLALHHIIKYRGNFLYEGQNFENITNDINETIQELIDEVSRLEIGDIRLSIDEIQDIISNTNISLTKKVDLLLNDEKTAKNELKNIFNGMVGLKVDLKKVFKDIVFDEDMSFKFSDDNIDEKLSNIENILGDDYSLIEIMKKIYSWSVMGDMLKGETYISFAKVNLFEDYKKDLKILKDIVSYYDKKEYKDIFKSNIEGANYKTYVNNKNKNIKGKNKTAEKLFYERIEKFINNHHDEYLKSEKDYILQKIKDENFLIKQNTTDNSAIPYQLNELELIKILENQSKYYNTISENKDKILKLLNFRVPYYVGPLNQKSEFAWVEKIKGNEKKKIYPWNMEQIVDIDASAEGFIKRMTNKCTYLTSEDVLPRNSLLFSDYMYYNEINKIRINGEKIDNELKEDLREKVFLKKKTVSRKDIENWYRNNHLTTEKECKVEGLQGDQKAASSLSPYIDFINIFGEVNELNREQIERIIEWITIFEDKNILKRKISKEYPNIANDKDKINKILRLKYKGWGRLSRKLLNGIYYISPTQQKLTIIDILKDTDLNFMQIINNKQFAFDKRINEGNKLDVKTKITYDNLIKDLQGSTKIKRGVWQSIKIIEEIVKLMGHHPKNIFIEFARDDEESKRTNTKKNKLEKLYAELGKVDSCYINEDTKKLLKDKKLIIDNKRKQLYFMQLGKCMYTGEPLNFDQLHTYETDHIIYQSLVKDDSLDNMVLVTQNANQKRSNQVMPANFVSDDIKTWWKYLKDKNLISNKKYNNLMKRDINRYEEEGFINRQLVETRQISKHVANILINCYEKEGTKIVPIKASLVDDFRKNFDIYKIRELNDYHHAKDAFITSVIGNYILNRFESLEKEFIYGEYKKYKSFNDNRRNKYGFIIGSMNNTFEKDGKEIWTKNESINKVKKQLNYKDCFITKRVCENKGELFKGTIYPRLENSSKNISNPIPIKQNLDVNKYGYYTGEQIAYCSIIEYKKGQKRVKSLIGVPIRYSNNIGNSKQKLKEYFENVQKLEYVIIIKPKIFKYQLFKNEKGMFYLASPSEWHNAKQLLLDKDLEEIVYKISEKKYSQKITDEQLIYLYDSILDKIKIHYPIFSSLAEKISKNEEIFESLSKDDKAKIIYEILKITKANGNNGNLKLIKGSDREGRLSGKTINIEETTFIYPSVTGLFTVEENY